MNKSPRKFFEPLAIGAPAPFRELPVRVERMIHFVPPHLEKVRAKIRETIAARPMSSSAISKTPFPPTPRRPRARALLKSASPTTSARPACGRG